MTWDAVADRVEVATGETVLDHRPLDSVASRVYEATLSESGRVVVKVPRIEGGRLSEPRLLSLVERRTDLPVPRVLAVEEDAEPSFLVTEHVDGRRVDDLDDLRPGEVERFAREVGRVLGTLHGLALPVDAFGRLRCDDAGSLYTLESFGSWRPRFRDLLDVNLDALSELRLGDLAGPARERLEDALASVPDATEPALNYHDPKVANFVLAPPDEAPLVRAVLDWGALETTHWAYTLAFAERVLDDEQSTVPPEDATEALLAGYAGARGWDAVPLDEEWFDAYRLAARVLHAASPYWLERRDDWSGDDARRVRASIRRFL